MDAGVTHWERRDGADRNAFGMAALGLCRALKATDGVQDARFYWSGTDNLVVLTHVDSAEVLNRAPSAALAAANFGLADLARETGSETWFDAATGKAMYDAAL